MKIGILGGGQLGRMLIQSALKYDDEFYTLDPAADAPCHNISYFTQGNFNDYQTVLDFGKDKDVVTIEIEHVNADALETLESQGVKVVPNSRIIKIIQQKILQKEFYKENNIPSPDFQTVQNKSEINFPLPFVQKMNTGGYDGKGVQVIRTEEDLQKLWDAPSVLESLVDIDKELAVIVARNENGETKTFPVTEMVADPILNLLDFNICPTTLTEDIQNQISAITDKFLAAINSPGLFAIELFLDKDGKVWVNETAPRLHNSGHQSQEGNTNSQFEQMYRVVKNLPLADTDAVTFSGMLNLVGAEGFSGKVVYAGLNEVLKLPKTYIHLYGKTETKPGRKMGHINVLADSREELMEKLVKIKEMVQVIAE
ncbi:5-(carboxyamino)imidazole ribonucleotide synthase [Elizabethkingia anophelis]|uniref:N5-carboxyaminoimidazole ribonucleotide synthase n=1 Tax=Elizabethkingia anophelis TaxID=1117645 RepID=A0A494J635_9FLAO|nr:5-(carboxyamino)imidazole ribonucleotide synthase [Elizabethkingia anophelis]AQX49169.1 5-(carboxyamino)imidazole ribonucleotide synthase [Elizabethkingia anophelis]ELB0068935.1 5-(carboxyamino)imidazole ribonucleotide synthase [Elizabethkingia anophelis]ELB0070467.1 5-(carboxyamino)imidazole ribonucleotide synthase [Elizabethkingia anophelis]ELB1894021.1 5-(carboxyamino)imidazole ribonucleotide synthase [Elizabethkingia anophelis]ELB1895454.1 5-(carboxyamino)imidazole ribonucleotide syntha